jgi:hypothetical protein
MTNPNVTTLADLAFQAALAVVTAHGHQRLVGDAGEARRFQDAPPGFAQTPWRPLFARRGLRAI